MFHFPPPPSVPVRFLHNNARFQEPHNPIFYRGVCSRAYLGPLRSLQARVLFVNVAAKIIGLSAAPHIVHLVPVTFELQFGDIVDPATIVRVDPGAGVTLSFAEDATAVNEAAAEDPAAGAATYVSWFACFLED